MEEFELEVPYFSTERTHSLVVNKSTSSSNPPPLQDHSPLPISLDFFGGSNFFFDKNFIR